MIRWLDRLVEAVAACLFAASTLLICINVFYRYVILDWLRHAAASFEFLDPLYRSLVDIFGTLSVTADEVPGLLLVWIAFLGAYLAMRERGHISFDLVVDALPPAPARIVRTVIMAMILGFLAIVFWHSVRMIRVSGRTEIETAEIAQGWFMAAIPIAVVLLAIALLIRIKSAWRGGEGS